MDRSVFCMGRFTFVFILFLISSGVVRAENDSPNGETTPGAPAPQVPDSSSQPKVDAPVAPPSSNATDVWSTPEPGHPRDNYLPEPPPPVYQAPPPYPYRYRRSRYVYAPEPDNGEALKEFGLTVGTPSIVNLNVGYWGPNTLPMLFRVSGMYYGQTRGGQIDIGYVFQREAKFRQYVAISAVAWQMSTDVYSFWSNNVAASYKDVFYGIGPAYGLNWFGLSFQIGVAFGQDNNTQSSNGGYYYPAGTTTVNQFQPQLLLQVGYTFLW
jgi:hypothetical protein